MILSAIVGLAIGIGGFHGDPLVCPVMGTGEADHKGAHSDYNGVRYWYCCGGCQERFEKEPAKYTALRTKGKPAGVFLFDPVSGDRVTHEKAIAPFSDYKGVRFMFASTENKAKFDKDPKRYGTLPEKDALYCSVGKEVVQSYGAASGYVDHKGVRYYMCCKGCETPFLKEPEKNAELSKTYVKAPVVATEKPAEKKKDG